MEMGKSRKSIENNALLSHVISNVKRYVLHKRKKKNTHKHSQPSSICLGKSHEYKIDNFRSIELKCIKNKKNPKKMNRENTRNKTLCFIKFYLYVLLNSYKLNR